MPITGSNISIIDFIDIIKPLIWDASNPKTEMFVILSCSCRCPIHWSQVLSQWWRCSWSSANRRCSNHIWVINNFIAYIRGLTVSIINKTQYYSDAPWVIGHLICCSGYKQFSSKVYITDPLWGKSIEDKADSPQKRASNVESISISCFCFV